MGPSSVVPIPTQLNTIPHSREARRHFYGEVSAAVAAALAAGERRIRVRCTIPELNTEFDVYRVGTLLELVRDTVAEVLAEPGVRSVRVCVQQALGQGVFQVGSRGVVDSGRGRVGRVLAAPGAVPLGRRARLGAGQGLPGVGCGTKPAACRRLLASRRHRLPMPLSWLLRRGRRSRSRA